MLNPGKPLDSSVTLQSLNAVRLQYQPKNMHPQPFPFIFLLKTPALRPSNLKTPNPTLFSRNGVSDGSGHGALAKSGGRRLVSRKSPLMARQYRETGKKNQAGKSVETVSSSPLFMA